MNKELRKQIKRQKSKVYSLREGNESRSLVLDFARTINNAWWNNFSFLRG